MDRDDGQPTSESAYADRLVALQTAWWKRLVPVQAPYRWNLRRLGLDHTLDIGCGIGRNLDHLAGNGVGIDHNATSVAVARTRGFEAFTPDDFMRSRFAQPNTFDSVLFAHVLEHLEPAGAAELVQRYLTYVRERGNIVIITPQERGFRSDPTHVAFLDFGGLRRIADACGLRLARQFSFPFPRWLGRAFPYNEFVVVAERPTARR